MLTLDNFEAALTPKIAQRGHEYFKSQAVESLDEDSPGNWSAVVSGSEDYEVGVVLSGRNVAETFCDCPYDGGPVCKHVVAVLYALREQAASPKRASEKVKRLTFEDLLLKVSAGELRDFVRHQRQGDREFGEKFMLFFAEKDPRIDVSAKYEGLIRGIVRHNSSKGFMEYRQTFAFSKEIRSVLSAADTAIAQKNYRDAFAIAKALCHEVMQLIQVSDDSAGNIGGVLSSGVQIFESIAEAPTVSPELLDELLRHLEKQLLDKSWFDYGDYGYDLLAVAEKAALRTQPEAFLNLLDALAKTHVGKYSDYQQDHFKKVRIRFLQGIGRAEEAEKFVAANLDIVEVRMGVVQQAIDKQDFIRAKQLVAEGIQIAEGKKHSGTVATWEKVLLDIARRENDVETVRRITHQFAFDRGLNVEFYQAWKATYSPAEWPAVIERYIQAVIEAEKAHPRRGVWDVLEHALFLRLSPIFIQEEQWERLLNLLPKDPGERELAAVRPYLARRYPQEILALYLPMLENLGDNTSNRKEYAQLAELMRKLKQDIEGSHTAVDRLAAKLIQKYPRRPAMEEELERVLRGR
jgi:hypothetical protein